jgi:hypothetical protein
MSERLRKLGKRYREWRMARQQEGMRRFVAWANQPERVAALEEENEREYGRLSLTDEGFRLDKKGKCEYAVHWGQIIEIQAYKHWPAPQNLIQVL